MTDAPVIVRPNLWLLLACIGGVFVAPLVLMYLPNPFLGLESGARPSRFIVFLWVGLVMIGVLALWRLLSWTTYRASRSDGFEIRSLFGVKRLAWSDLQDSALTVPIGTPPAYVLYFKTRKVRMIAAHYSGPAIKALSALTKTL